MEGFELTLERRALSWFQILEPIAMIDLSTLEKDFILTSSEMELKHNVFAQIYIFKQKEDKSVRDCTNRLRQYIICCPKDEKPKQGRLISIFLEGLRDKVLHECRLDTMDYDGNFELSNSSWNNSRVDVKSGLIHSALADRDLS